MATLTLTVCDLHEQDLHVPASPVQLVLRGKPTKLDLCEEHQAELQQALQPYLDAARVTSPVPVVVRRRRRRTPIQAVPAPAPEVVTPVAATTPKKQRAPRAKKAS